MSVLDSLALEINVKLGNTSAFSVLQKGLTATEEGFKSIQSAVQTFESNLNLLGAPVGELAGKLSELAQTNPSGLEEIIKATQGWADILNTAIGLENQEKDIREKLAEANKEQNELTAEAIKQAEIVNKSQERYNKAEEELLALKERLAQADPTELDTIENLSKAIINQTQAVETHKHQLEQDTAEFERVADAAGGAADKVERYKDALGKNQDNQAKIKPQADEAKRRFPNLIGDAINEKAKETPKELGWIAELANRIEQFTPAIEKIGGALGIPIAGFREISSIISGIISKLKVVGTIAIIPAMVSFTKSLSEEWRKIDSSLRMYTSDRKKLEGIEDESGDTSIYKVAVATGNSYKDIADTFVQMKRALGSVTGDDAEILKFTQDMKNAFEADVEDGGTEAQAERAQQMLGRVMQMKSINGRMMEQIITNSPHLAEAIAKGLNTSISGLRQMANEHPTKKNPEGGLTTKKIFEGIRGQSEWLNQEAERAPYTWEKAFTRIHDAGMIAFGNFEQKFGFFDRMRHSLDWIQKYVDALAEKIAKLDPNTILLALKGIAGIIMTIAIRNMGMWIASNTTVLGQLSGIKVAMMAFNKGGIMAFWTQLASGGGILGGLGKGVLSLVTSFKTMGQIISYAFNTKGITGAISAVIGLLKGGLMGAIKGVIGLLGGPWTIAIAAVLAILEDVYGWINGDESVMELLFGSWSDCWKGIQEVVGEAWDGICDVFNGIAEALGFTSQTAAEWAQTFSNIFWGALKVLAYVIGFIVGLFTGVGKRIRKVFAALKENNPIKAFFLAIEGFVRLALTPLKVFLKVIDAIFKTHYADKLQGVFDELEGKLNGKLDELNNQKKEIEKLGGDKESVEKRQKEIADTHDPTPTTIPGELPPAVQDTFSSLAQGIMNFFSPDSVKAQEEQNRNAVADAIDTEKAKIAEQSKAMQDAANAQANAAQALNNAMDKNIAIDITSGGEKLGFLNLKLSDLFNGRQEKVQLDNNLSER